MINTSDFNYRWITGEVVRLFPEAHSLMRRDIEQPPPATHQLHAGGQRSRAVDGANPAHDVSID